MEIIKSRFLAIKAAQNVDVLHRYYTTRKYKELELYKESPFQVGMIRGYGISFNFYPIDEKSYRLVVKETADKSVLHGNMTKYFSTVKRSIRNTFILISYRLKSHKTRNTVL